MPVLSKPQLYVLLAAVFLLVLLLIAPRKGENQLPVNGKADTEEANEADALLLMTDSLKGSLAKAEMDFVLKQEEELDKSESDTLYKFWINKKQPAIAASVIESRARATNSDSLWAEAGKLYYKSVAFMAPAFKDPVFKRCIRCYENALKLKPTQPSYKIGLAACFVEGSTDPMKGIALLREVLVADSNNFEAHLRLGMFAVQSQQYDKAVKRFNKLLTLNPEYLEAYLYLGQTYASMGKKKEAIEALNSFKTKSSDELIKKEVDAFIDQLKNENK